MESLHKPHETLPVHFDFFTIIKKHEAAIKKFLVQGSGAFFFQRSNSSLKYKILKGTFLIGVSAMNVWSIPGTEAGKVAKIYSQVRVTIVFKSFSQIRLKKVQMLLEYNE